MAAYYNEIDPFAAEWLRILIAVGLIAEGDVDTRSIEDVRPADLTGYTQCHFFAGLGGWSHALRLAGWSDDRPVWTGSCPCQPFSAAGKRGGVTDERHLWPAWSWLIRQCKPSVIFGEQVASKDGRGWLDLVQTDLEAMGFAVGAGDICAAGVGAPHIRQRLYFVADSERGTAERHGRELAEAARGMQGEVGAERFWPNSRNGFDVGNLADSAHERIDGGRNRGPGGRSELADGGLVGDPDDDEGSQRRQLLGTDSSGCCAGERLIRPASAVSGQLEYASGDGREQRRPESSGRGTEPRCVENFWSACDWLPCIDGKARPVEPGTFPLAHGVPGRVGRLRAYGNAIVPQVAAEMIAAYMELTDA